MTKQLSIIAILLAFFLTACGSDTDNGNDDRDRNDTSENENGGENGTNGDVSPTVTASGDGWTAEFPGPVENLEQAINHPDIAEPLPILFTLAETDTYAIGVATTVLPEELLGAGPDVADAILIGAAEDGTVIENSPFLDSNNLFRGNPGIVFEMQETGMQNTTVAFLNDDVLFQLIYVSTPADHSMSFFEAFVNSVQLTN